MSAWDVMVVLCLICGGVKGKYRIFSIHNSEAWCPNVYHAVPPFVGRRAQYLLLQILREVDCVNRLSSCNCLPPSPPPPPPSMGVWGCFV